MPSAVEFCFTHMREAMARSQESLPDGSHGERYAGAWGYLCGSLMRMGLPVKAGTKLVLEPSRGIHGTMTAADIIQAIGVAMVEVIDSTPTTMLTTDPAEAVEDMATRLVLEALKHGLVIIDRKSYDGLVTECRDLRSVVARQPST